MEQVIGTDPKLLIGSTEEVWETVCKTILDGTGTNYDKNDPQRSQGARPS